MKILIMGGTVFLGRHLVEAARQRGHEVTLFNRGRSNPDLFPDLERLKGDRVRDLDALRGRQWDAVIDPSGYTPATVREPLQAMSGGIGHYTYISSVSAYATADGTVDEDAALNTLSAEEVAEGEAVARGEGGDVGRGVPSGALSYGSLYGGLKALSEQVAEEALPGRVLTVRPGLIVGPHDYSDRFTYWVRRVARGGEVLAPGRPTRTIRVIDVRDLAEWILRQIEAGATGVYNATGPPPGSTMGEVLERCQQVAASDARFTWLDDAFLIEQEVGAWLELPLWLPEDSSRFFEIGNDKAIDAGLTFRPLATTIADTLAWDQRQSKEPSWETGLAPEREAKLLRLFRERSL